MSATPDFSTAYGLAALAAAIIPIILGFLFNVLMGIIAVSMAKKRNLRTVPAFFAGLFGSFLALFFIAMIPKNDQV